MRRTDRGVTLTELLVVVSVITIMVTIGAPVIVRVHKVAVARACAQNLSRIYEGFQLYANDGGKFPACFDLPPQPDPASPINLEPRDYSWWYHKVARTVHPDPNVNPLEIPTSRFKPQQCFLRCPASRDHYDQNRTPSTIVPRVADCSDIAAKDRVYDENYGYNNFGFIYGNALDKVVPNPDDLDPHEPAVDPFYHTIGGSSDVPNWYVQLYSTSPSLKPQGYFETSDIDYTHIGALTDIPYPGSTILMMDYAKPHVVPIDWRDTGKYNDGLNGYRFARHGDRSNVLFVDGKVQGHTERNFFSKLGFPGSMHWEVRRRP